MAAPKEQARIETILENASARMMFPPPLSVRFLRAPSSAADVHLSTVSIAKFAVEWPMTLMRSD
jgi:hypothetical protein